MKTKEKLLVTIPVIAMIAIAGVIYWFLIYRKYGQCVGLQAEEIALVDFGWCLVGLACAFGILFVFIKLIPMKLMYDPNVRILADSFSMKFLAIYFIPNAFYEELIFRGALQPLIGLVPAALIFALIHISYYKRPVILVEAFLQGLVLGALFQITGSVWITTIAHAAFNTLQVWMIKKDVIEYRDCGAKIKQHSK